MGILSGLSNLGLGKLEEADIYEKEEQNVKPEEKTIPAEKVVLESDFLFDKTYTCPVCSAEFKTPTLKANKARMIGQDNDLRPRYENIDPLKYDVVACPHCGYAALTRNFPLITPPQAKLIKENISKNFRSFAQTSELSYDQAIERHQLCLANTIVKRARASEKAYVCMKMAWVIRGKMETYNLEADDYDAVMKEAKENEIELLKNAYEGFLEALKSETPPFSGMDETTVDYLIATIAVKFGKYDVAGQMLQSILNSMSANKRIKDKARELKDQVIMEMKQKQ